MMLITDRYVKKLKLQTCILRVDLKLCFLFYLCFLSKSTLCSLFTLLFVTEVINFVCVCVCVCVFSPLQNPFPVKDGRECKKISKNKYLCHKMDAFLHERLSLIQKCVQMVESDNVIQSFFSHFGQPTVIDTKKTLFDGIKTRS